MNKLIITLILAVLTFTSCKKEEIDNPLQPPLGLYESMIYQKSEIQIIEVAYTTRPNFKNMQYTSGKTKENEIGQDILTAKMDIYLPPNANPKNKQPLLINIHGGGFIGGDKRGWQDEAYTYARAGYICASLNYRLTDNQGNPDPQLRLFAVQCSLEDIQNGIRFLKKNADTYFIDTNRIVVLGSSAGGALSLINAVEYDAQVGKNDYISYSSKTNGSISTGATLINDDPASQPGLLHYDSFDSPVLLLHAKENDSSTGATWTNNVLPTQQAIKNAGNSCTIVAQPNMTHTVGLELGGNYWQYIKPFLFENLRISVKI